MARDGHLCTQGNGMTSVVINKKAKVTRLTVYNGEGEFSFSPLHDTVLVGARVTRFSTGVLVTGRMVQFEFKVDEELTAEEAKKYESRNIKEVGGGWFRRRRRYFANGWCELRQTAPFFAWYDNNIELVEVGRSTGLTQAPWP